MLYMLLVPAVIVLMILLYLRIISPGKPGALTDADGAVIEGSISEKIFIDIGGVRQGMFVRSKNPENPVLLYIHGGPAFPNYFLIEKYNPRLEDFFTVCYWEQRGGGLSWSPAVSAQSMTTGQLASDAIEVANYLRVRFKKGKITLLAHSGGTTIALTAVSEAPELFHAYIAMAQMTRQAESEKRAYAYLLEQSIRNNDTRLTRKLMRFNGLKDDAGILAFYNSAERDVAMHQMGIGTMRNMKSVFTGIFLPVWACRAYTLEEKFNIWRAKLAFLPGTTLRSQTLLTDYPQLYPRIDVPIFFISGKYDLTVNASLSESYFQMIDAPLKRFYTFENSAHSPLFEEPERFRSILQNDILPGVQ